MSVVVVFPNGVKELMNIGVDVGFLHVASPGCVGPLDPSCWTVQGDLDSMQCIKTTVEITIKVVSYTFPCAMFLRVCWALLFCQNSVTLWFL